MGGLLGESEGLGWSWLLSPLRIDCGWDGMGWDGEWGWGMWRFVEVGVARWWLSGQVRSDQVRSDQVRQVQIVIWFLGLERRRQQNDILIFHESFHLILQIS